MTSSHPSQCPVHGASAPAHPAPRPSSTWPPGPRSGPTGWGLLARMARDLPSALADWQRAHGDVVHLRIWPEHEVLLADPALARELLVNHHDALVRWERGLRVFAGVQGQGVLVAEGEAWRHRRHALLPAFQPRAVQALVPGIAAAAAAALDRWPARDPHWPIESALTALAMDVILRVMFGSGTGGEARQMEQAVHACLAAANRELYWPASWPDWMPWKRAKRQGLASLRGLVEHHLQHRLAAPRADWPDDLLSRLLQLHLQDATAWPLQAVRDECMTTFLAGHETVAATLTWWAWCMAAHPQAQDAARAEVAQVLQGRLPGPDDLRALPVLTRSLQETLRLYPAAPVLFTRRATRPITLGPWAFPARTMFIVAPGLMHRDARWFPQPDAFRPERFAEDAVQVPRGAYLPFGAGPRVCIGQHLAMAEMAVAAALVLARFRLAPGDAGAPEPQLRISLRPRAPLHLALQAV